MCKSPALAGQMRGAGLLSSGTKVLAARHGSCGAWCRAVIVNFLDGHDMAGGITETLRHVLGWVRLQRSAGQQCTESCTAGVRASQVGLT